MLDRLYNQSAAPVLEKAAGLYTARHALLAENIVNASTPGYRQRDVDVDGFRGQLRRGVESRRRGASGVADYSGVVARTVEPETGAAFHDGNNRSVEHLMSDQASNAMRHNLVVELLRKQFQLFDLAIRDRLG